MPATNRTIERDVKQSGVITAPRTTVGELIANLDGRILIVIGVANGGEAREVQDIVHALEATDAVPDFIGGFVLFVSGYLCAAEHGLPDHGLVLRSELARATDIVEQASWLASLDSARAPLAIGADIDTGYGNEPSAVILSCRQMHKQGASYVQLEDQLDINKTCGHLDGPHGDGKKVLAADDMIARRLRPALAYAEAHQDFTVLARTDALASSGIDEAINRALAYAEAGCPMVFVEAPRSIAELERVAHAVSETDSLAVANMVEGSPKTPYLSARDVHKMGFSVALSPIGGLITGFEARRSYWKTVVEGRTGESTVDGALAGAFERLSEGLGRRRIEAWNRMFGT